MHWDWILKLDWNIICSAVTAISTFLMMVATCFMAVAAWRALNTWKKELFISKKIEIIEELLILMLDIKNFLENIISELLKVDSKQCEQKLEIYSKKLAILKSKVKVINNKELTTKVEYCIDNIKPIFYYKSLESDGSVTMCHEYFVQIYTKLHNNDFKTNLDNVINDCIGICEKEQINFYN